MTRLTRVFFAGLMAGLFVIAWAPAAQAQADDDEDNGGYAQGTEILPSLHAFRLGLEFHPVAYVLDRGKLNLGGMTPMHPAGLPASDYIQYIRGGYGLGGGWQVNAGLTGVDKRGPDGQRLYSGFGVQKELMRETSSMPAVSVGTYGSFGPGGHNTLNLHLVGTKKLTGGGPHQVFLTGGGKFEHFDGVGSSNGVRPFVGATYAFNHRFYLTAEYSPNQAWEFNDQWALRGTLELWRGLGITGGIRNNGYNETTFIGVAF